MTPIKALIGSFVFFALVFGGGYVLYKHSGFFVYEHSPMRYMPDMHQTRVLRPQREYNFYKNKSGSRLAPKGTLARGLKPYAFTKKTNALKIPKKKNPLKISKATVLRGQMLYNSYCIVCHGTEGAGEGSVVGPFPNPPSLHTKKILRFADSQIFHVITTGQNLMGSYASQIRPEDRWAIIHYIRVLQLSQNPSKADIKAFEDVLAKGGAD